jgi:hypothetical protein
MLELPALYASKPTVVTKKLRAGFDAFMKSDALTDVESVTKRIWSVTRTDDEYVHSRPREYAYEHGLTVTCACKDWASAE